MHRLGHEVKPLPPFFSKVKFRARTWRDSTWGSRAAEGRLVAPSTDISKGYIIRVDDPGVNRLYASTLFYKGYQELLPDPEIEAESGEAEQIFKTAAEVGRPAPEGSSEVLHATGAAGAGSAGVARVSTGAAGQCSTSVAATSAGARGSGSSGASVAPSGAANLGSQGAAIASSGSAHPGPQGAAIASSGSAHPGPQGAANAFSGSAHLGPQGATVASSGSAHPGSQGATATVSREVGVGLELDDIFPSLREDSAVGLRACQAVGTGSENAGDVNKHWRVPDMKATSVHDPKVHHILQSWVQQCSGNRSRMSSGYQRAIGAFRHGGIVGVSSGIDQCTEVSKLLIGLLEAASPGAVYNAISVSSDCCQAPQSQIGWSR